MLDFGELIKKSRKILSRRFNGCFSRFLLTLSLKKP